MFYFKNNSLKHIFADLTFLVVPVRMAPKQITIFLLILGRAVGVSWQRQLHVAPTLLDLPLQKPPSILLCSCDMEIVMHL